MEITKDIRYVGVNDSEIDLFEGQYAVPNGIAYNSYLILDEKIAVFDTVDVRFGDTWLANVERELAGRAPDYLIVQHMEPDHSANIVRFLETYPGATVVATAKAFAMMKGFFGTDFADRRRVVAEGDALELGAHILTFLTAPMVHWPEVMMTYDRTAGVLFSADAFGKFGVIGTDEPWEDEARRYYIGIVGKYGAQVQTVLKKAAALKIGTICPLHGPVLDGDLSQYLALYDTWSSYRAEKEGVLIAYTSVYGNTAKAVAVLAQRLRAKGGEVEVFDLARTDMTAAVAKAFCYSKLVLATTTYNADIFPFMRQFIDHLLARGFRGRTVALIENGSWAPMAAKVMRGMLEGCRELTLLEPTVRIVSALNEESYAQIDALADQL